ncbi:MAG TPA: hypothetical protein VF988_02485 [Verrucomicrobiae bacterium]
MAGGLLAVSYHGSATTNCFPAFDGNGNVMALVTAADGTSVAKYEYGPFGKHWGCISTIDKCGGKHWGRISTIDKCGVAWQAGARR